MTGRLGAEDLAAMTNTTVYSVPAQLVGTVTINVCNRNVIPVSIRLAVTSGNIGTLTAADYIEYNLAVDGSGVLERTGIVLYNGQSVIAYSDTANVSVQVWGWEETA